MFNRPDSIEKQLSAANKRLEKASAALAPKHKGGEVEEYRAARQEVLRLERELAKSKGEPYAVSCDFPVQWDVGAPLPYLLCNDDRTYLTFYVNEPDPNWDGTYVNVVDPSSSEKMPLCLVTFKRCCSAKLGYPNDEVQGGHPLARRGQEGYSAQLVMHSPWTREVATINSAHPNDRPERWDSLNHYIFWFHDSTFECLAEEFEVEVTHETMAELLSRVQAKLLE